MSTPPGIFQRIYLALVLLYWFVTETAFVQFKKMITKIIILKELTDRLFIFVHCSKQTHFFKDQSLNLIKWELFIYFV